MTKRCWACRQDKPLASFGRGYHNCSDCWPSTRPISPLVEKLANELQDHITAVKRAVRDDHLAVDDAAMRFMRMANATKAVPQ